METKKTLFSGLRKSYFVGLSVTIKALPIATPCQSSQESHWLQTGNKSLLDLKANRPSGSKDLQNMFFGDGFGMFMV